MAEAFTQAAVEARLPRVTIQFCTQCKWMLRAAYYAQELLSTFSTSLGEVALQPATGGVFVVEITTAAAGTLPPHEEDTASTAAGTAAAPTSSAPPGTTSPQATTAASQSTTTPSTITAATVTSTVLWDRKTDGGFPETKELKRRVRDVIQPGRDLGHVDRDYGQSKRVPEGPQEGAGTGTGTDTAAGTGTSTDTGHGTLLAAVMVAGQGRGQGQREGQEQSEGGGGGGSGGGGGEGSKVGVGEVKEGDDSGKKDTTTSCAVGEGERCEDCE